MSFEMLCLDMKQKTFVCEPHVAVSNTTLKTSKGCLLTKEYVNKMFLAEHTAINS